MTWEFTPNFDASVSAAIVGKKPLVYHCPPAWWVTLPLLERLGDQSGPGLRCLVVIPDGVGMIESAAHIGMVSALGPIHPATGLIRTATLIGNARVRTLVIAALDVVELIRRSAIHLSGLDRVIIGWPEMQLDVGASDALDTLLAECRAAQRVILTSEPAAITAFLERHAHRAVIVDATDHAASDIHTVRYAVTSEPRLASTVGATLDVLNPTHTVLWDPVPARHGRWQALAFDPGLRVSAHEGTEPIDLALGVDLPTPAALAALAQRAKQCLFLIEPWQVKYLHGLTTQVRSLRLPTEADRAPHRARQLRETVRDRIASEQTDFSLLALAPLFDEYDPAIVAAAAAHLPAESAAPAAVPAWVRLRLNAGRNRIKTGDVVGVLLNSAGLTREQVGRVALRERFATVEIRADVVERARRELDGVNIRGHRLAATLDRR